jgi:hypothetical protein
MLWKGRRNGSCAKCAGFADKRFITHHADAGPSIHSIIELHFQNARYHECARLRGAGTPDLVRAAWCFGYPPGRARRHSSMFLWVDRSLAE